jgi:hypothetical protein
MAAKQLADVDIAYIVQYIKNGIMKPGLTAVQEVEFKLLCEQMELVQKGESSDSDLLYHLHSPNDCYNKVVLQLYIPAQLRNEVMSMVHDDKYAGHMGWTKTYAKAMQHYYWPTMKADIQKYCASCDVCNRRKTPKHKAGLPMLSPQQELVGADNMDAIAVDVFGPLPSSGDKYTLVLVVMCMRTRWVELYPLKQQTSEIIANILVKQWMMRYGIPQRILTDKGAPFESHLTKEICKLLGIDKRRTAGYHPQTNGMVERFNGTIIDMIAKYTQDEHKAWSKCLPYVQFAYNTSVHSATGYTPYRMLFGREANIGNANLLASDTDAYTTNIELVRVIETNIKEAHALADMRISKEMRRRAEDNKNITSRESAPFKVGQRVWIYKPPRTYGSKVKKLLSPWMGPYTIVEQKGPVTYRVRNDETNRYVVVHATCMKLYTTNRVNVNVPEYEQKGHTHTHEHKNIHVVDNDVNTNVNVNDADAKADAYLSEGEIKCDHLGNKSSELEEGEMLESDNEVEQM